MASKADDKFDGVAWEPAGTGAPILPDTVGVFDCRVEAAHDAGDHVLYVGRVEWLRVDPAREPLLYQSGSYGAFQAD